MNKQYTAVDRSAQLRHWKYIKKKRGKNGKWIYYYDKEQIKDDLDFGVNERLRLTDAKQEAANRKYAYEKNSRLLARNWNTIKDDPLSVDSHVNVNKKLAKNYDIAQAKVQKCLNDYSATPLGKLENFISAGKKLIADTLEGYKKNFVDVYAFTTVSYGTTNKKKKKKKK